VCHAARIAVENDPCQNTDVFGHKDEQVQQWPLFSPAELYDMGAGTIIWAWIAKKWYRGVLSVDEVVAFDDGQQEPWRRVVAKCLQKQRLRVEKWICLDKVSQADVQAADMEVQCDEIRHAVQAKSVALGPQAEEVLRLQEDLALMLSRMGRTVESRPLWRKLLKARVELAPSRAGFGRPDKRNAKVWYTVCARKGAVGAWDGAAAAVPAFCSSNNSAYRGMLM